MLKTEIFDPFFSHGPAQTQVSRFLLQTAASGEFSVNGAETRLTWTPFPGAVYEIVLIGTGLTYGGGKLTGGQVDTVLVRYTATGAPIIRTSGLNLAATALQANIDDTLAEQDSRGETSLWADDYMRSLQYDPFDQKVVGSNQFELLIGGDGDDTILGRKGDDIILVTAGDDTIDGGPGSNRLRLLDVEGQGAVDCDLLAGTCDFDDGTSVTIARIQHVELGNAGGSVSGNNAANILSGGDGIDTLIGLGGNDTLWGHGGNDILLGAGGNDLIFGGDGNDRIEGNNGNDELFGEAGVDNIKGGDGDDFIDGGDGDDPWLVGNKGKDKILGGGGKDFIGGGAGADTLDGGAGRDEIFGHSGNDNISGASSNDRLFGETGADTIKGGAGNDRLDGGHGEDTLRGGKGNDKIEGGADNDLLSGDAGDDEFLFRNIGANGVDVIDDFAEGDLITLKRAKLADVSIVGEFDVQINYAHGQILVAGVGADEMEISQSGNDVLIMLV